MQVIRRLGALGICGALLASACSAPSGLAEGSALEKPAVTELRILPVPPGEEWVLMSAYMHNISPSGVELFQVRLEGEGLGDVVHVIRTEIAPIDPSPDARDTTPGGVFKTYPPVILINGEDGCRIQLVIPVKGFVLQPDAEARILVLMRADDVGRFRITAHVVEYRQGPATFEQSLPIGLAGQVSAHGKPMKQPREDKPCDSEARVLPSGQA